MNPIKNFIKLWSFVIDKVNIFKIKIFILPMPMKSIFLKTNYSIK